ncbi:hypothetical protein B0H14DRAFT_2642132 [Mycena olivaceomarginata]|nr:hypothetical protein B0H14DRAFT_2642132 [Mycena olivaceomarginata]
MYNANANLAEVGGHGSTRLHMDIADALNVMMYAARDPAGAEGCAAWEIFRAQNSTKLREFLRSNCTMEVPEPIHSQEVVLRRRRLWAKYGVQSYRTRYLVLSELLKSGGKLAAAQEEQAEAPCQRRRRCARCHICRGSDKRGGRLRDCRARGTLQRNNEYDTAHPAQIAKRARCGGERWRGVCRREQAGALSEGTAGVDVGEAAASALSRRPSQRTGYVP